MEDSSVCGPIQKLVPALGGYSKCIYEIVKRIDQNASKFKTVPDSCLHILTSAHCVHVG